MQVNVKSVSLFTVLRNLALADCKQTLQTRTSKTCEMQKNWQFLYKLRLTQSSAKPLRAIFERKKSLVLKSGIQLGRAWWPADLVYFSSNDANVSDTLKTCQVQYNYKIACQLCKGEDVDSEDFRDF